MDFGRSVLGYINDTWLPSQVGGGDDQKSRQTICVHTTSAMSQHKRLTVAAELQRLGPAVLGGAAATGGLVEAVALADTTRLLAGRREAAELAVLVNGLGDPVDARVAADRLCIPTSFSNLFSLSDILT